MKLCALLLLAACGVPANAAPVHVALKSASSVSPNADGFFTLGAVADVTGGDAAARTRLSGALVGRAPLYGETRRVTRGDVALKLRQAGWDPEKQAVLEGAERAEVTTEAPRTSDSGGAGEDRTVGAGSPRPSSPLPTAPAPPPPAAAPLHRGDAVTIVIRSDALTISAPGTAREDGRVGDTIHVHREGVMTDLSVRVLDAKTVQLEI